MSRSSSRSRTLPVQIGSGFSSVAAGTIDTVAVKTDGTLWAWGYVDYSYTFVYQTFGTTRTSPVQIGTGFHSVAAGTLHALAVKADGALWAWGNDGYGQLGIGEAEVWPAPIPIP